MIIRTLLHPVALGSALAAVMIGGCSGNSSSVGGSHSAAASIAARADGPAAGASVRVTVASFGARIQTVSLLAPDSTVEARLREAYGALVAPELPDRWMADPRVAPGRLVFSPWPDSIQVRAVRRSSADRFEVSGGLAYATSADRPEADDESARSEIAGSEIAGKATAEHEPGGWPARRQGRIGCLGGSSSGTPRVGLSGGRSMVRTGGPGSCHGAGAGAGDGANGGSPGGSGLGISGSMGG